MQNGKTIKTRKNVDFNVDIFKKENKNKKILTDRKNYANLYKYENKEEYPLSP